MTTKVNDVTVTDLPEIVTRKQKRLLLHEVQTSMDTNRPRVVIDCSRVSYVDKHFVHLLLCCLEEAMKRNGDVKLAALSADAESALREIGADRIFNIYVSTEEALRSFGYTQIDDSLLPATLPGNFSNQRTEYTQVQSTGVI